MMTEHATATKSEMNKESRCVLACIDGSKVAQSVCDYSAWIANRVKSPVKLLHTIERNLTPAVADLTGTIGLGASEELLNELTGVEQNRSRLMIEQGQRMLNAAYDRVHNQQVKQVEIRQRHGGLAENLIEMESQIRILVLGIRGESHQQQQHGIGHQLESTIRALHKPILVVNTEFNRPQNVMLAYDGSESCEKALRMLATSPLFLNLTCHLVHVGDKKDDKKIQMMEQAKQQLKNAGLLVETAILNGNIEDTLARYQIDNRIDLMAMGAFGHTRLRNLLLGSFTVKMLNKTQRPVLVLR